MRAFLIVVFAFLTVPTFAQSTIAFTIDYKHATENAGTIQLDVVRTGSVDGTASVNYLTIGTSAVEGVDYVAATGTLTFEDQESQESIQFTLLDDNVYDEVRPRVIEVRLTDPVNASLSYSSSIFIYVADDDPEPPPLTITVSDLVWPEGDGETWGSVTATLNRPHSQFILTSFRGYQPPFESGYNNARVYLTEAARFEPGETTKQIPLRILGNDTYENVTKTFHFSMMPGPMGVSGPDFDITLVEDDPLPAVSIADLVAVEGSSGPTEIQVTLTTDHPATGVVYWSTSDDSATMADIDYGPFGVPIPVHFNNSNTAVLTLVAPYGDLKIESDETFFIDLTSATNMTINRSRATITIRNDDNTLPRFAQDLVRIEAGTNTALTINFPAPAPAGSVSLSSSDAAVHVPAVVAVPRDAMSVTFMADVAQAVGPVTVTAHLGNALGNTAVSTMVDTFRDSDLEFDRPRRSVFAGQTSNATLRISPARDTAQTVTLQSSAGIDTPDSVVVPPGGDATFPFTALLAGTGWILATHDEGSTSLLVDIAAQAIMSVAPGQGASVGGSTITIRGNGFSPGCRVKFGDVAAATTFIDGQTLRAITPAHRADLVDVTVTCGTTPAIAEDAFRFAPTRRRSSRH